MRVWSLGSLLLGIALAGLAVSAVCAQQPVKIGLITTLSGPAGYLGADIRDGFLLAAEMEGGKLGGVPVQVLVEDDGFKPGQGKQIADKFLKSEKIKLFTGIVFSNIVGATVPDILDAGAIYVSPNAAPSNFSGKDCNKNYYVVSWQNDIAARKRRPERHQSGLQKGVYSRPQLSGRQRRSRGLQALLQGEIVGELYTRLDQTDYAPEMAQIRAAKPDVVFQFHPGGLGISFMRQYQQAGLLGTIPMVVAAPSMDTTILKAIGDAAIGVNVSSQWNLDFDNEANKKFVAAWQKKFGTERLPTFYASQGYDTALAIGAGLKGVNGDLSDTDAFRTAMLKADFHSVRGAFKFGNNQHPIQDWYAMRVEKGADGKPFIKTIGKIMSNHGDAYAKECKL